MNGSFSFIFDNYVSLLQGNTQRLFFSRLPLLKRCSLSKATAAVEVLDGRDARD